MKWKTKPSFIVYFGGKDEREFKKHVVALDQPSGTTSTSTAPAGQTTLEDDTP